MLENSLLFYLFVDHVLQQFKRSSNKNELAR